eukprot:140345-Alexandrium_andersonii.AAC.1
MPRVRGSSTCVARRPASCSSRNIVSAGAPSWLLCARRIGPRGPLQLSRPWPLKLARRAQALGRRAAPA